MKSYIIDVFYFNFNNYFYLIFFFKSLVRFIDVQDYECNENDKQVKDHLRIASMSLTNSLVNRGPGEVPTFNSFYYQSLIYSFKIFKKNAQYRFHTRYELMMLGIDKVLNKYANNKNVFLQKYVFFFILNLHFKKL